MAEAANVPAALRDAIADAQAAGDRAVLDLLGWEVASFAKDWRESGLCLVGAAHAALDVGEPALRLWDRLVPRVRGQRIFPDARKVLVFTGHRLDSPGRKRERFPARSVDKARGLLREAIDQHAAGEHASVLGIAGGASGGDILFHEVCDELGIETELLLVAPPELYVTESVADAGDAWVRRFDEIRAKRPCRVLQNTLALPEWVDGVSEYSVWQRNNVWTLYAALAASPRVDLFALWNREEGDGPGGTADMVAQGRAAGADVQIIDAGLLIH